MKDHTETSITAKEAAPNIFGYQNPQKYLLDVLAYRQRMNSQFSARAWAREMGLTAHSLLIMLLQGTRPLRLKHVEFLTKGLSLSTIEHLYFRVLIQLSQADTHEEKQL